MKIVSYSGYSPSVITERTVLDIRNRVSKIEHKVIPAHWYIHVECISYEYGTAFVAEFKAKPTRKQYSAFIRKVIKEYKKGLKIG